MSNSSQTSQPQRTSLLGIAAIIVFVLAVSLTFFIPPSPAPPLPLTNVPTTSTFPTITNTYTDATQVYFTATLSLTPTSTPSLVYNPSPIPSVFIGTLGPEGFNVVSWRDDSCGESRDSSILNITGIVVNSKYAPYEFIFEQFGQKYIRYEAISTATPTLITLSIEPNSMIGRIVIFNQPVPIRRDKYVHVTITFRPESGDSIWVDDLLYLSNSPNCFDN